MATTTSTEPPFMASEPDKINTNRDPVVEQDTPSALISAVGGTQARDGGGVQPASYVLRSARLVHEMTKLGLIQQADVSTAKLSDDTDRGCDDALWQAPDMTVLARVPGMISFEAATTDTSSLATCTLCSSFSVIEAGVKVMRAMASPRDQLPDTVDARSVVCLDCGTVPAILGVSMAIRNRLANEEMWHRSRSCTTAPVTPRMRVYYSHAAGIQPRSAPAREPVCYSRLYDWHKYLGSKSTWQWGHVTVHADYVPTVTRYFVGCIGTVQLGPEATLAIAKTIYGAVAFDSLESVDEKDYEVEDGVVKDYLAGLRDPSLPNREALLASCTDFVCRSALNDFGHTLSADPGKVIKLSRAEAIAVRSSDLAAQLTWPMATGWTKQELLQARADLLAVTGPSRPLLLEVLGMQVLHNDIVGYTPDVASGNCRNTIHMMEPDGATAGPLAEMQDAHCRIAQLAELEGGALNPISAAIRIANGNAGFSWTAQRYALLSNAHAMQAPREWQVASWWRWVATIPGSVYPKEGDPYPAVNDQTSTGHRQRWLSNWARSCAWRVAPHRADFDIRQRVYTELAALTGRVDTVEAVVHLTAGAIADVLLANVWATCVRSGTETAAHCRLGILINHIHTTLREACERYSRPCTIDTHPSCCVDVATTAATIFATMDEALGCVATLDPDERLRHSDYLLGAICVILWRPPMTLP